MRAALVTLPAVATAGAAHSLAGGCTDWLALTLAGGMLWPLAVLALGRQARVVPLVGWLLLAQLATHVLMAWLCTDPAAGWWGVAHHLAQDSGPGMLAMHLLGALLSGLLLAAADAGVWCAARLRRAILRLVLAVAAPLPVLLPPRRSATRQAENVASGLWSRPSPVRRGPPGMLPAR